MGAWRSLKLSTLVFTALSLLFYGPGAAHFSAVHNSTDRRALLDFKEAITVDPTGALRSWNDSIHHCMWPGVNCSRRHPGRVMVLDLQDMSLAGQITPSLGNLTSLRKLTLDSNRLSGKLPPQSSYKIRGAFSRHQLAAGGHSRCTYELYQTQVAKPRCET